MTSSKKINAIATKILKTFFYMDTDDISNMIEESLGVDSNINKDYGRIVKSIKQKMNHKTSV
jgi:hypothetical protein